MFLQRLLGTYLVTTLGVPWIVDSPLQTLPLSSRCLLFSVFPILRPRVPGVVAHSKTG